MSISCAIKPFVKILENKTKQTKLDNYKKYIFKGNYN